MYRNKYRPKRWEDFIGNKEVVRSIRNDLGDTQCYILYGERGCGKTSLARIIKRYLRIHDLDTYELDAASNNGIDEIRRLKNTCYLLPSAGKRKVYIIDECHRLTGNASDALLKITEEPPEHVFFILCTTEYNKVSPTMKSRGTGSYQLKPLQRNEIIDLLEYVIKCEKLSIKNDTIKLIAGYSQGIPREALNLLQRVKACTAKQARKLIEGGLVTENENIINLCRSLLKFEPLVIVLPLLKKLSKQKENPESIRKVMLAYMNSVILGANNPKTIARSIYIMECFIDPTYDTDFPGITYATYLACKGKFK